MRIIPLLILSSTLVLIGCSSSGSSSTPSATSSGTTDAGTTDTGATDNGSTDTGDTTAQTAGSTTENGGSDGATDGGQAADGGNTLNPEAATYRITFNATWSAETHATQFPGASAHFSGLVGAVHGDQVTFWEPGQIASDGIELMAETGGKSIFFQEIDSAINSGYALFSIDGPGVSSTPGSVSVEVTVSSQFPKVTLATMLAPSPDWFTGFHDINLLDENGFVERVTIDGFVYDSGTDSGVSYRSSNSDTQPRDPIIRLTSEPTDAPFVSGLPIAGQFVIEKL